MRFILCYFVFVFSNLAMASSGQDLTPPQLVEFEVSPKTVDVSSSSQQVTVLMRITDNDSGVQTPRVSAGSDINDASTGIFSPVSLISGNNVDGVWQAILTVPQGTTAGGWSVSVFPLSDNADNSGGFGPGEQFDSSFQVSIITVKNDVDGDGKSDLLWRSSARGWNFLWAMNGTQTKLARPINVVQDDGWLMAGQGDYDGDGKSDILWRNNITGLNFIYLMDGLNIKARQVLNYVDAPQWELAGSGDFNGDGKGDVLWHDIVRGRTQFYMMNGLRIGTNQPSVTVTDLNEKIVAIGDVNGDGTDDVIWRNQRTGGNSIWIMENGQIADMYALNRVSTDWTIAGAGDLDGDGTDDIVLRNQSDGRNWAFLMENGQIKTSQLINTVGSLDWQIANMGDYDGDGKIDILWRNEGAARNIIHLMDGLTIKDKGVLRPTDNTWQLAN